MITHILAMALMVAQEPPPTDAAPPQVALQIDFAGLLEHQDAAAAEETATFLRQDTTVALRQTHGVEVVDDAQAPAVVVELGWVDYAQSNYQIVVRARRPDEVAQVVERYECECIDSGVIESVLQRLPEALQQLEEQPPAPAETAEAETVAVEPEPPAAVDEDPPAEEPSKARPIGAVGITGAVVAAGGLGALGFGISRLSRGEERRPAPMNEERQQLQDFRPQGRVWVGIGVGAAVVGTAVLVVDLTVLRRRRQARVALTPTLGPSTAGLQLHGRF